ncbi:MAG: homogentisate 1,2-dioxygenase [Myxococcales bacterium]
MIDYRRAGRLPDKPHTVFRAPDGRLYHEHCFTRDGFDGPFSILYHERPPQAHGGAEAVAPLWAPRVAVEAGPLRRHHLLSQALAPGGSPATGRVPLLFNGDLTVGVARPTEDDPSWLANGDGDDLFFVLAGGGELLSWFGRLRFGSGDYVCVPRAVAHRFVLDGGAQHWLWVECRSGLRVLNQYRNGCGQLRMDAPYTHRDFRAPVLEPVGGPRELVSKRADRFTRHLPDGDVADVVGWDGVVWPFAFHISRFSPKAGQVHLPPTVHGTFATGGSLICSFVPRVVDFGAGAIPCPYPHSNVQVDEVLFYCDGDFTSRRGVSAGSLSLHPAGVPHGPHPGAYEISIGVREVRELAVMIDTFEPLALTAAGQGIDSPTYDDTFAGGAA